jgi:hypothetical protein
MPNVGVEHIAPIVARVTADVAARQARWLQHDVGCGYWPRLEPSACSCDARPVVDLLLHLSQRAEA